MVFPTSERLSVISPSATLAITAKAKELRAAGKDVIGFGAGEPDFDTPEHIKEAARVAIAKGLTKYTPVGGTPSLKKAVAQKLERDNLLSYELNEITTSNGGKQCIYNAFMACLNKGDEVILPVPCWVSYPDQLKLAEARAVSVFCGVEQNYLMTAEQLEAAITPQTKMLIINSPCNPSGAAYTKEALISLGEVLKKHPNILILTDDIYEHIMYNDQKFYNLPMLFPELQERTLVINGVSKAYSMTGWRIGFCAGPREIISAMEKIQGQSTSNPCSISQAAAEEALIGDQSCVSEMKQAFARRRDQGHQLLSSMKGVCSLLPQGAFYLFPDIREVYQTEGFQNILRGQNDDSLSRVFCTHLLEKYETAVVPGIAFGNDNSIRLSYALDDLSLQKGLERIGNMIQELN